MPTGGYLMQPYTLKKKKNKKKKKKKRKWKKKRRDKPRPIDRFQKYILDLPSSAAFLIV